MPLHAATCNATVDSQAALQVVTQRPDARRVHLDHTVPVECQGLLNSLYRAQLHAALFRMPELRHALVPSVMPGSQRGWSRQQTHQMSLEGAHPRCARVSGPLSSPVRAPTAAVNERAHASPTVQTRASSRITDQVTQIGTFSDDLVHAPTPARPLTSPAMSVTRVRASPVLRQDARRNNTPSASTWAPQDAMRNKCALS
jgi:hypothetical protein